MQGDNIGRPPGSSESKSAPEVTLNPSNLPESENTTTTAEPSSSKFGEEKEPEKNAIEMTVKPHDAIHTPHRSSIHSIHSITMVPATNGYLKDPTSPAAASSPEKSRSCYFRLIGINLLTLGVDLCSSAGFTYIPPMMLKAGFSQETMTVCMGIGPFLSLILVPLVGHWSDTCRSRWGRRRPFIFALSVLQLLSLLMVPYSKEIASDVFQHFLSMTLILAVGTVILDFTSQALLNPCKALVSDLLLTGSDRETGFTIYSCMLSVGACFGYLLTSLNWKAFVFGQWVGSQEKAVFILLFILFTVFVIINLCLAKEQPYRKPKCHNSTAYNARTSKINLKFATTSNGSFSDSSPSIVVNGSLKKSHQNGSAIVSVPSTMVPSDSATKHTATRSNNITNLFPLSLLSFLPTVTLPASLKFRCPKACCLFYLPFRLIYYLFRVVCAPWLKLHSFLKMPRVLRRLFVANIISWMGIMCHNMFYTDFVGQVIYQGKPLMSESSSEVSLYDEGIRMGSWGLLLQAVAAASYAAFVQDRLIDRFGQSSIYVFGMLTFTVSMVITVICSNMLVVNACTAVSGIGLAAITTIPYSLLTTYYSKPETYYPECKNERGIGEDMAVLDAAYYLSQIIPSMFVGSLVDLYGSASAYMVVSAVCGAISCISSLYVIYPPKRTEK